MCASDERRKFSITIIDRSQQKQKRERDLIRNMHRTSQHVSLLRKKTFSLIKFTRVCEREREREREKINLFNNFEADAAQVELTRWICALIYAFGGKF